MKKITLLLPYANPHVMGWIEELAMNKKIFLTVGAVESVYKYRPGYFEECDFYDSVNYFFKSKNNQKIFFKSLKNQDCFISLGIFSKYFFYSIFFLQKNCQVFILTEPFLEPKSYKKILYKIWIYLILKILKKNKVSFLAIGGKKVKDCYSRIGFSENNYYNFGYFPKTNFENSEKIDNKIIFLFVGQLIKRKGIDILLKSIDYLSSKYTNWEFRVAGSGELEDFFIKSTSNNVNVTYLGIIKDKKIMDSEYLKADVFFLPSYFDGWGAVVNEALSKSCSLLVSENVCAVNGLLHNGINGYKFNPNDIKSLKNIFDIYFNNPQIIKNHKIESIYIYNEWNEKNAAISLFRLINNNVNNNSNLLKII